MTNIMSDVVQNLYKNISSTESNVRPGFSDDIENAKKYYSRYTNFVINNLTQKSCKVLDIGCGEGWSTLVFREKGFDAHGLDLQPGPLEAMSFDSQLPYINGDAQNLPIENNSFDVVAMHNVLGHVPNPKKALEEALRVLKVNGRLIIVGPNIISFPLNGYWALRHTFRCIKQGRIWESRTEDMPSHPGGNTMPECWKFTGIFFLKTLRKVIGEQPVNFWMREPDNKPPFHANNDTCYYSNPMDVINWAKPQKNLQLIKWWSDDKPFSRWTWFLQSGMWTVLEKRDNIINC